MASTAPASLWWQVKQSTPFAACLLTFHSWTNAGDCCSWQTTHACPSLEIGALAEVLAGVAAGAGAAYAAMPMQSAVSTHRSSVFRVMETSSRVAPLTRMPDEWRQSTLQATRTLASIGPRAI